MRLELTKHHGLGNDFLVALSPPPGDLAALARWLCDRRRGIGADGMLVVSDSAGYTARMTLYNADGSIGAMSGNGIRCFAHAIVLRDGSLATQHILTDSGPRTVELSVTDRADTIDASVDMGEVTTIEAPQNWNDVGCDPNRPVMHLSLGNPHTVVGVEDVGAVDLVALGKQVPDTNLEIVEPTERTDSIRMRVHERGAGITEACGTGACASAWAARSWGLVPVACTAVVVDMDGGSATVLFDRPAPGRVTLRGPSVFVARMDVEVPDGVLA
jgi:diaminopimelate epimerase